MREGLKAITSFSFVILILETEMTSINQVRRDLVVIGVRREGQLMCENVLKGGTCATMGFWNHIFSDRRVGHGSKEGRGGSRNGQVGVGRLSGQRRTFMVGLSPGGVVVGVG